MSVEPDPEHFAQRPRRQTPEVDEVVSKAVFGIPRYQSIAADLERVERSPRTRGSREGDLLERLDARVATPARGGWSTEIERGADPRRLPDGRRLQLYDDLA